MRIRFIAYTEPEQLKIDLCGRFTWPEPWPGPESGVVAVIEGDGALHPYWDGASQGLQLTGAESRLLVSPNLAAAAQSGHAFGESLMQAWRGYTAKDQAVLHCPCGALTLSGRPKIMGILNVTPDSFSDGGQYNRLDAAVARAELIAAEGAEILDVGGESSRPGAEPVTLADELQRVIPVIRALRKRLDLPISIDTYKAEVARAAVQAGADIINDISGFNADALMAETAAALHVPAILMHMKGEPRTMQSNPQYDDLVGEVFAGLNASVARAVAAGLDLSQIIIDPGIGFGKTQADNFILLRRLREFLALGCPLLLGASRKSFIGRALDLPEQQRLAGSLAAATVGVMQGAHILRVHDVRATREAVEIAWRIKTAH